MMDTFFTQPWMYIEEALGFYLVATHVRVVKVFRGRDVVVVVHLLKCFIRYSESEEGRIGRWIEWRVHLSGICEYACMDCEEFGTGKVLL